MDIPELPRDVEADGRLVEMLNDRIRQINEALRNTSPAISFPLDVQGSRILRVGNPSISTDALNLGAADARYAPLGSATSTVVASSSAPSVTYNTTTGARVYVVEQTLTTAYTCNSPVASPNQGDLLLLKLLQDATGNHDLTLGSGFYPTSCLINPLPNKRTVALFVAALDHLWYPGAAPWSEL